MTDSIQIGDKWYISARVAHSDQRAQMIKHDGTFAVLDRFGDIRPFDSGDGLYEVYAGVPVVCSTTRAPSMSIAVSDMAAGSAVNAFAESAGAGASDL